MVENVVFFIVCWGKFGGLFVYLLLVEGEVVGGGGIVVCCVEVVFFYLDFCY